jgi:hypothetical protein
VHNTKEQGFIVKMLTFILDKFLLQSFSQDESSLENPIISAEVINESPYIGKQILKFPNNYLSSMQDLKEGETYLYNFEFEFMGAFKNFFKETDYLKIKKEGDRDEPIFLEIYKTKKAQHFILMEDSWKHKDFGEINIQTKINKYKSMLEETDHEFYKFIEGEPNNYNKYIREYLRLLIKVCNVIIKTVN